MLHQVLVLVSSVSCGVFAAAMLQQMPHKRVPPVHLPAQQLPPFAAAVLISVHQYSSRHWHCFCCHQCPWCRHRPLLLSLLPVLLLLMLPLLLLLLQLLL